MAFSPHALRADLVKAFAAAASPSRAKQQQAYMKTTMEFWGIPMDTVKQISKETAQQHPPQTQEQWQEACLHVWRSVEHREEWYFCETWTGLKQAKAWQTPSVVPMYEEMIVSGAWWDTVDWLAVHRIGGILMTHRSELAPQLRAWSTDDNLWRRRTAILSQNRHKQQTDFAFLVEMIMPSLDSKEFFLRKAIGWSLREYVEIDEDAVVAFVAQHKDALSGLSKREALKHVDEKTKKALL